MSLKESINKTESLKNNTRTAKNNINSKLSKFGIGNAITIADVPNKLEELKASLHGYAEGSISIETRISKSFGLVLPVDFDIKYLILTLTSKNGYFSKFLFEFNNSNECTNSIAIYSNVQYSKMSLNKTKSNTFTGSSWCFDANTPAFTITYWEAIG